MQSLFQINQLSFYGNRFNSKTEENIFNNRQDGNNSKGSNMGFYHTNNRNILGKLEREDGIGTFALVAFIIVAFAVGSISGVVIYSQIYGSPSESGPKDGKSLAELENQIENLQMRIESIEEALGESEAWNASNIYEEIRPSVVKLMAKKVESDLFGSSYSWSQGSGFIYTKRGQILTNAHVIQSAEEIYITFSDGTTLKAETYHVDSYSDIGVIKIDPEEVDTVLNPVEIGGSDSLRPGDRVIAIGNPFGLSGTITTGVVSQTERTLMPSTTEAAYPTPGVIQIDAAINPGNSGGPLLTFDGDVVGITTAIQSSTGSFSGIGFAVPSDLFTNIADSLIENGVYKHPWIGMAGFDIDYQTAQELGLEKSSGYLIDRIQEDSPAEDSDLKEGDVVIGIDEREVVGIEDILSYIELKKRPDEEITLTVIRDGKEISILLTLGTRPPPT